MQPSLEICLSQSRKDRKALLIILLISAIFAPLRETFAATNTWFAVTVSPLAISNATGAIRGPVSATTFRTVNNIAAATHLQAVSNALDVAETNLTAHTGSTANPHSVTIQQAADAGATATNTITLGGIIVSNATPTFLVRSTDMNWLLKWNSDRFPLWWDFGDNGVGGIVEIRWTDGLTTNAVNFEEGRIWGDWPGGGFVKAEADTNALAQLSAHTGNTSNPHTVTLQQAANAGESGGSVTATNFVKLGRLQAGTTNTQTHGINTAPASRRMVNAAFAESTLNQTGYGWYNALTFSQPMSNTSPVASYGTYHNIQSSGHYKEGAGKNVYGDYLSMNETATLGNPGTGSSSLWGRYTLLIDNTTKSDPSGISHYIEWNQDTSALGTDGDTVKYGSYTFVSGTADANYGVFSTVSGGTANWAFYSAGGNNYWGGDGALSYFGAANDASIEFDGNSFDIRSDNVTAGDMLNLRGGTNGVGFLIGSTEQVLLKDGVLRPTTDNDIDLGVSGTKEFKDIHSKTVRAKHYAADNTAPVADGTYTFSSIPGTVSAITIKDGIITSITVEEL